MKHRLLKLFLPYYIFVLLIAPPVHAQPHFEESFNPINQVETSSLKPVETLSDVSFHELSKLWAWPNNYAPANCTWGVASWTPVPSDLGDAKNWNEQAAAEGYTVSSIPIVGSVGQTDSGYWGHVVLVQEVYSNHIVIKEMNYDFNGSVRTREASINEFRYIYF